MLLFAVLFLCLALASMFGWNVIELREPEGSIVLVWAYLALLASFYPEISYEANCRWVVLFLVAGLIAFGISQTRRQTTAQPTPETTDKAAGTNAPTSPSSSSGIPSTTPAAATPGSTLQPASNGSTPKALPAAASAGSTPKPTSSGGHPRVSPSAASPGWTPQPFSVDNYLNALLADDYPDSTPKRAFRYSTAQPFSRSSRRIRALLAPASPGAATEPASSGLTPEPVSDNDTPSASPASAPTGSIIQPASSNSTPSVSLPPLSNIIAARSALRTSTPKARSVPSAAGITIHGSTPEPVPDDGTPSALPAAASPDLAPKHASSYSALQPAFGGGSSGALLAPVSTGSTSEPASSGSTPGTVADNDDNPSASPGSDSNGSTPQPAPSNTTPTILPAASSTAIATSSASRSSKPKAPRGPPASGAGINYRSTILAAETAHSRISAGAVPKHQAAKSSDLGALQKSSRRCSITKTYKGTLQARSRTTGAHIVRSPRVSRAKKGRNPLVERELLSSPSRVAGILEIVVAMKNLSLEEKIWPLSTVLSDLSVAHIVLAMENLALTTPRGLRKRFRDDDDDEETDGARTMRFRDIKHAANTRSAMMMEGVRITENSSSSSSAPPQADIIDLQMIDTEAAMPLPEPIIAIENGPVAPPEETPAALQSAGPPLRAVNSNAGVLQPQILPQHATPNSGERRHAEDRDHARVRKTLDGGVRAAATARATRAFAHDLWPARGELYAVTSSLGVRKRANDHYNGEDGNTNKKAEKANDDDIRPPYAKRINGEDPCWPSTDFRPLELRGVDEARLLMLHWLQLNEQLLREHKYGDLGNSRLEYMRLHLLQTHDYARAGTQKWQHSKVDLKTARVWQAKANGLRPMVVQMKLSGKNPSAAQTLEVLDLVRRACNEFILGGGRN